MKILNAILLPFKVVLALPALALLILCAEIFSKPITKEAEKNATRYR